MGEFTGQMKPLPTEWKCDHLTLGQKQASHTLPSSKIPEKTRERISSSNGSGLVPIP